MDILQARIRLYDGRAVPLSSVAIPLRSYVQPLLIMTAIPFGVIGAILGHW